jgi:hypothetical protein
MSAFGRKRPENASVTTAPLYIIVRYILGKSLASTIFEEKVNSHQSDYWPEVTRIVSVDVVQTSNLSGLKRYSERFYTKCLIFIVEKRPAMPFRRVRFPSSPPEWQKNLFLRVGFFSSYFRDHAYSVSSTSGSITPSPSLLAGRAFAAIYAMYRPL